MSAKYPLPVIFGQNWPSCGSRTVSLRQLSFLFTIITCNCNKLLSGCNFPNAGFSTGGYFVGVISGANKPLVGGKLTKLAGKFRPPSSDHTWPIDHHSSAPGAGSDGLLIVSTHQQIDPSWSQVRTAAVGRHVSGETPDEKLFALYDTRAGDLEDFHNVDGGTCPVSKGLLWCHLRLKRCIQTIIYLFIHSFTHSITHSITHSFIHSFIHSLIN